MSALMRTTWRVWAVTVFSTLMLTNQPVIPATRFDNLSVSEVLKPYLAHQSGSASAEIVDKKSHADVQTSIPYQIKPIFVKRFLEETFGSDLSSFNNIFTSAILSKSVVSRVPVVSSFAESEAACANCKVWAGNFVGVVSNKGGTAISIELNPISMAADGTVYGLVVASAGQYPIENALQIQANPNTLFKNGIVFNGATSKVVSGSLIYDSGASSEYILRTVNGVFSKAEIDIPSLHVSSTADKLNSRVLIESSSSGEPTISAEGAGREAEKNSSLLLKASGHGLIRLGSLTKVFPNKAGDLPLCNVDSMDSIAVAVDAQNMVFGSDLHGGGKNRTLVYCDGVAWKVH